MSLPLKKIVIIGPESTGKSSLCEGLAAHYQTSWVREYAREYLLANGMNYSFEDLTTIAKGQLALEDEGVKTVLQKVGVRVGGEEAGAPAVAAAGLAADGRGPGADPILFIDTDMYVMKVWSEFVFGRCESWILDQIGKRQYDAYLLCKTDLPWVKDELREYPDLVSREKLYHIYRDILINQSTPWAEIGGQEHQRLEAAIAAVETLL
ncbi:MAG TPA: ATP-binding protein [Puia sp.]|nr:ATP-binding protein [Puia sp.]